MLNLPSLTTDNNAHHTNADNKWATMVWTLQYGVQVRPANWICRTFISNVIYKNMQRIVNNLSRYMHQVTLMKHN